MLAAEEAQVAVVERLHAERDPVDAGDAEAPQLPGLDRGRVGLERDLQVGVASPPVAGPRSITAAAVAGAIREGVPPPKKIEVSRAAGSLGAHMVDLGEQGAAPAVVVDLGRGRGC